MTSAKEVFVVGADIREFLEHFVKSESEMAAWLLGIDGILNSIEDLDAPSVVAINGIALGGGFECCLAASFRVMSTSAKVGLSSNWVNSFDRGIPWNLKNPMPRLPAASSSKGIVALW